jgi:signal transduction histidine kinase
VSIRTRLTLWYTALLATLLLTLGLSAYFAVSAVLVRNVDDTLSARASEIIVASEGVLFGGQFDIQLPELDPFQKAGLYIQGWTADGRLHTVSDNLQSYNEPLDPLGMPATQRVWRDVTLAGGARLRVLTVPLAVQGEDEVVGYLQIGVSLAVVDQARRALVLVLLPGGLAALLLSWFGGAFLAGRALKPIDALTRTAVQISRADDLGRRIEYHGPPDEVGRLAGAFNHMLERLEGLFGAQRRFIADISHELRTPLTTIRGNLDLIRRMGADDVSLDAIQSEAERMRRLVGDLMLLARVDAGELPIRHERVDLDTLLLEIYRQARTLAAGRVEVTLGEEDQACVVGDPDRLRQLLLNLVDNAIKYTPRGGRVTLGLYREDARAVVRVSDTGAGIPESELPHVFERFYRVDKARARSGGPGGAGLGLSIARWIAQAHGGELSVASEVGAGSTFSLSLPIAPPVAESPAAQPLAGPLH